MSARRSKRQKYARVRGRSRRWKGEKGEKTRMATEKAKMSMRRRASGPFHKKRYVEKDGRSGAL
jgi:hypothetical protein